MEALLFLLILFTYLGCQNSSPQKMLPSADTNKMDSAYNEFMQMHFGTPGDSSTNYQYKLSENDGNPYSPSSISNIEAFNIDLITLNYDMGLIIYDRNTNKFYSDFMHFIKSGSGNFVKNHLSEHYKNSDNEILEDVFKRNDWTYEVVPNLSGIGLLRGLEKYLNDAFKNQLITNPQFNQLSTKYLAVLGANSLEEEDLIPFIKENLEEAYSFREKDLNIDKAITNYIRRNNETIELITNPNKQYNSLFSWNNHIIYIDLVYSNLKSIELTEGTPVSPKYHYSVIIKVVPPPVNIIGVRLPMWLNPSNR